MLNRVVRLVRLKPPDPVEHHAGVASPKLWPFRLGFLDPVLAEVALADGNQRFDRLGAAAFADRDQLDARGIALGEPRRLCDAVANMLATVSGRVHALKFTNVTRCVAIFVTLA